MKRIGIEINGVLRDTLEKFKQVYEKHLIDGQQAEFLGQTYELDMSGNTEQHEVVENNFNYEILSEPTSLELTNHFSFQNKEELYSFMFEEYTMELFGHAPSTEINTFNVLNELYYDLREFGCLLEKVIFYSETTKKNMWNEVDVLLTANPELIKNKPDNKLVIKFETNYNKDVESEFKISTLSDFNLLLKKIKEYV